MTPLHLAVTACAVAQAFGLPAAAIVRADTNTAAAAASIEDLQNRLLDLRDQANNIQARADAERRDLNTDEVTEIDRLNATFEATETQIERRRQVDAMNARLAAPQPRKVQDQLPTPDADPPSEGSVTRARAQAQPRLPAQPRMTDTGKWGFRSQAEFFASVVTSCGKGSSIDPRLIANAAPGAYGSEGVNADGGFAVPPDFRQTILTKVMGEDSLLSMTDQQTASGNTITFPADETTPWQTSGGIQAYWGAEGAQKTPSKPSLTQKVVSLNKVYALVPLTDELLEDAPAMANFVNRKAPEKINFKVNDAIINGDGTGKPLGILASAGTVTVPKESGQAADTVVFGNILKLYAALTPAARRNAKWIVNPDVESQLYGMQFPGTGTAVPVFLPPGGLSASPYPTLMGRPVITTEASPALGDFGDIIFGDLQNYLTVVKAGGIKSDVSIHIWFDYDMTAFRFVLRVGGQPWWSAPVTAFSAGATPRGFFAALAARA